MAWQTKLERAKRHFAELGAAVADFFTTQPYKVSTRRNAEGKLVYYLSEVETVPVELSAITGDVIQNLRSALDHLAYALWVKEANGRGREDRVYFPIHKDATSYNQKKRDNTQGISAQSLATIDSLTPYKGGNDVLWRIHTLNNLDKHRLLVTVGSSFQSVDFGAYMLQHMRKNFEAWGRPFPDFPDLALPIRPADNLFPLHAGDELVITSQDDEENQQMRFQFSVLLHEPGVVDGEPVNEALAAMIAEVERIGPLFDL